MSGTGDVQTLNTDVCIIGAGPAGLTIARELAGGPWDICIIESGGFQEDDRLNAAADGRVIGLPYDRLSAGRVRVFGGAANRWCLPVGDEVGMRIRPLDPTDFERRDWVPHSGWPFGFAEMSPFYDRAHQSLGVGTADYAAVGMSPVDDPLRASTDTEPVVFRFARAQRFVQVHRDALRQAGNVSLLLQATVAELITEVPGGPVIDARVRRHPALPMMLVAGETDRATELASEEMAVRARVYILAAGGTENPRILLNSTAVDEEGLGNSHDLVGRFFMEHPHLWAGRVSRPGDRLWSALDAYEPHIASGHQAMLKVAIRAERQRRAGILNYCFSLNRSAIPTSVDSFWKVATPLRHGKAPQQLSRHARAIAAQPVAPIKDLYRRARGQDRSQPGTTAIDLNSMSEQAPNPDSRVTLSNEIDAFGTRRVTVDWRLTDLDIRTINIGEEIAKAGLEQAGAENVLVDHGRPRPPFDLHGGWHHMGTTRMHADPRHGVVDAEGRVHDSRNLFVAGSSVFPTVGYANPTLTIIALAHRLADRLKRELAPTTAGSGTVTPSEDGPLGRESALNRLSHRADEGVDP